MTNSIDVGLQGNSDPFVDYCARFTMWRHNARQMPGSDFCAECLAWLRGESDYDPCGDAT